MKNQKIYVSGASKFGSKSSGQAKSQKQSRLLNLYVVTPQECNDPCESETLLLLSEPNLAAVVHVLKNATFDCYNNSTEQNQPYAFARTGDYKIWMLDESAKTYRWVHIENREFTPKYDYRDYDTLYANEVRQYWKNEIPHCLASTNRLAISMEYDFLSNSLDMLFYKPKITYSKYAKNLTNLGLRFLNWVAHDVNENPFMISTHAEPNDALIKKYESVGDGGVDAQGARYYQRKIIKKRTSSSRELLENYYLIRKTGDDVKVSKESNQFNINNGVYRVKIDNEWNYFSSKQLIKSETIGRALDIVKNTAFAGGLIKDLAKNQQYHCFTDLSTALHGMFKQHIDTLTIERLDEQGNWLDCAEHGFYYQNECQQARALLEERLNNKWHGFSDKDYQPKEISIDTISHRTFYLTDDNAKTALSIKDAITQWYGYGQVSKIIESPYSVHYSYAVPHYVLWMMYCNENEPKFIFE